MFSSDKMVRTAGSHGHFTKYQVYDDVDVTGVNLPGLELSGLEKLVAGAGKSGCRHRKSDLVTMVGIIRKIYRQPRNEEASLLEKRNLPESSACLGA